MGKKTTAPKKRRTYLKNTYRLVVGDSRIMKNVEDESVQMVVTSPPAWQVSKGAGLGKCRSIDEYRRNLTLVWQECHRALAPGCMLCIHIERGANRFYSLRGNRYISFQNVIVETTREAGFINDGVIVYQPEPGEPAKKDTKKVLPRTGALENNVDLIMTMRKPGSAPAPGGAIRDRSSLSAREAKKLLSGLWLFPGDDDNGQWPHFPEELAQRLIKLYSYAGETVLDPFAGHGATALAARALSRSAVAYELDDSCCDPVEEKMTSGQGKKTFSIEFQQDIDKNEINKRLDALKKVFSGRPAKKPVEVETKKKEAQPEKTKKKKKDREFNMTAASLYNVDHIVDIEGSEYKLAGVEIPGEFFSRNRGVYRQSFNFVQERILNKELRCRRVAPSGRYEPAKVYIYLDNGATLNESLIKSGYALSDRNAKHELKNKFNNAEDNAKKHDMGMWALKKTDAPRSS